MTTFLEPVNAKTVRLRIPPTYVLVTDTVRVSTYLEIVRWVISSGVLDRGLISPLLPLYDKPVSSKKMWEIYLGGIKSLDALSMMGAGWEPVYPIEFHFAQEDDAVLVRMKFL